jgi:crotonobetainyl-CoA:carnitine CoA-transferase CaiB-like acyl-CoA transferase
MQRLGLDYPAVRARAPQIIYASLSSFGQTGRYRLKAAHDMVMQAMAGTLSFNLGRDGLPTNPPMPMADMTGSMMAFSGVLMALLRQRETGEGDCLDIALHDCLLSWTANYTGSVFAEHRAPDVKQERNWGGAAFYNIYATADDDWIVLGGVEHNFCHAFLEKAGRLDLYKRCLEPPGPAQAPVKEYLTQFFAQRTLAQSLDWLSDINVCYAPLRTLYEGIFDENTAERGMLLLENGEIEHLGIPIKFANEPGRADFKVPELGEHSRDIAASLGYGDTEIAQLVADGVI